MNTLPLVYHSFAQTKREEMWKQEVENTVAMAGIDR